MTSTNTTFTTSTTVSTIDLASFKKSFSNFKEAKVVCGYKSASWADLFDMVKSLGMNVEPILIGGTNSDISFVDYTRLDNPIVETVTETAIETVEPIVEPIVLIEPESETEATEVVFNSVDIDGESIMGTVSTTTNFVACDAILFPFVPTVRGLVMKSIHNVCSFNMYFITPVRKNVGAIVNSSVIRGVDMSVTIRDFSTFKELKGCFVNFGRACKVLSHPGVDFKTFGSWISIETFFNNEVYGMKSKSVMASPTKPTCSYKESVAIVEERVSSVDPIFWADKVPQMLDMTLSSEQSSSDLCGTKLFSRLNNVVLNNVKNGLSHAPVFVSPIGASILKVKDSKGGKLKVFSMKSFPAMGLYNGGTFMVAPDDIGQDLTRLFNSNIHITGVDFSKCSKVEEFAIRTICAMHSLAIGYEKIFEGLSKGYKIFLAVCRKESKKGKIYFTMECINDSFRSVGPLGEGSTTRFINPKVIVDTEFGENVSADGVISRRCFEATNKVVAREMKLGAGKTEGVIDIGDRQVILIDRALNGGVLPRLVERMLVLGTAWVSPTEFKAYGHARIIPLKAVTAPMPKRLMDLPMGCVVAGGNSHKSKLNGVLYKALGLSHTEISALSEGEARNLLRFYEVTVNIGGYEVNAYKFSMKLKVTNFYSLYSLEGGELIDDLFDDEESTPKSFFLDAQAQVEMEAKDGGLFDLNGHIEKAIKDEVVKRKPRKTEITSAEVQQVSVSYGFNSAKRFIDDLCTEGNVKSKYFMFEKMSHLPKLSFQDLYDVQAKYLIGDVEPTIVPFAFYLGLLETIGDDSKGFVISHRGYDFPFSPIGNLEDDGDGFVADVPDGLKSVLLFIIALRNKNTNWVVKYDNHMAELNGNMIKKVQVLKTQGAYLAAVTGFWLKPTEVFSFGDAAGKVTVAKLPILFDQAITSLTNQDGTETPYSASELLDYEQSFSRGCFVSPEYFLSQENDGDGDLVKIMRSFKSIPIWSGQPSFTNKKVANYTKSEYEGLTLSLKGYHDMSMDQFDGGNKAAKVAKDNVAIMAANEYRTKQLMLPYIEAGTEIQTNLGRMVAEASAYLVQYEAMRAVKHDGAVSNFVKCKTNPKVTHRDTASIFVVGDRLKVVLDDDGYEWMQTRQDQLNYYTDSWKGLLNEYFDYTVSDFEYFILQDMIESMYMGELDGLCVGYRDLSTLQNFVLGGELSIRRFSYAIQQKGHARNVGSYTGKFIIPREGKDDVESINELNATGANMFRKGGMFSVIYSSKCSHVGKAVDFSTIAATGDIFAYTLMKFAASYNFVGPRPGKSLTRKEDSLVSQFADLEAEVQAEVEVESIEVIEAVEAESFDNIEDFYANGIEAFDAFYSFDSDSYEDFYSQEVETVEVKVEAEVQAIEAIEAIEAEAEVEVTEAEVEVQAEVVEVVEVAEVAETVELTEESFDSEVESTEEITEVVTFVGVIEEPVVLCPDSLESFVVESNDSFADVTPEVVEAVDIVNVETLTEDVSEAVEESPEKVLVVETNPNVSMALWGFCTTNVQFIHGCTSDEYLSALASLKRSVYQLTIGHADFIRFEELIAAVWPLIKAFNSVSVKVGSSLTQHSVQNSSNGTTAKAKPVRDCVSKTRTSRNKDWPSVASNASPEAAKKTAEEMIAQGYMTGSDISSCRYSSRAAAIEYYVFRNRS